MEFVNTSLHVSAASGNTALLKDHGDTVAEFVSVDRDLIRVKGREGFTVLHYVACHGNVQFLSRFLDICPDCIFDLTIWGQTALHISAENNRFKAFETIVEWIQRRVEGNNRILRSKILNLQDKDGNTALHLAAANNQPKLIISIAKPVFPEAADTCNGVSTNSISSIRLKISVSS
ncbi:hypothetical protein V6N13_094339 [Hibiscus sabdariffa]|uniref:Uncharacterized protein n=1 Tax=Hibiscus sabdariffa TaxID=183260 RepID=A0ABR2PQU9_9ROSI